MSASAWYAVEVGGRKESSIWPNSILVTGNAIASSSRVAPIAKGHGLLVTASAMRAQNPLSRCSSSWWTSAVSLRGRTRIFINPNRAGTNVNDARTAMNTTTAAA